MTAEAARPGAPTEARARLGTMFMLAVTIPFLAWLALALPPHIHEVLDPAVLVLIAAVIIVDLIPVPVWGEIQLSLSFPILIGVIILFSPPVAAAITFVASIDVRELKREVSVVKALYNRSQMAVAILAGSVAFHAVARPASPWHVLIPAVLVASLIAYVVNTAIVAALEGVLRDVGFWHVVASMHGSRPWEFLISYIIGLGLFGLVIARFYEREGVWSVLVFLAPLIFARQMYFRSRALADQLAAQNKILADQASRLEQLLEKEHQTVDELRQLNRMKEEFVAVVSHELRTPVTALIGYAKTLQQSEFADDAALRAEFLDRMERQGDRLLRLVENLLTAARLESEQLPVAIARVRFEDVCRDVVESLGAEAERVVVRLERDLPSLYTDRQLLGRVIQNLIDNALKYSPDGSTCELGARSAGDRLVFWVRDRGIGIPEQKLDRIFERFYQVDSSSTRTFRGAGLGLSLVADLLERLGGTIDVESVQGSGSTFTVTLPPGRAVEENDRPSAGSTGAWGRASRDR
jgi:signal transduction histidine kinase